MHDGPDIQHKATGFNADHSPVPIVEPDIFFDDPPAKATGRTRLDAEQILDAILDGAGNPQDIAARAVVLGMLLKRPAAPKTQAEFALLMDMPRTTAQRFWARVFQCLQGSFSGLWASETIDDGTN